MFSDMLASQPAAMRCRQDASRSSPADTASPATPPAQLVQVDGERPRSHFIRYGELWVVNFWGCKQNQRDTALFALSFFTNHTLQEQALFVL